MLEALRLTASADAQLAYQREVPIAQVPAEVLYCWPEGLVDEATALAGFRPDERTALAAFDAEWRTVWDRHELYMGRHAEDVLGTPEWTRLMAAAATALAVLDAG